MSVSLLHTTEQLEAARSHNSLHEAVRIILRHLHGAGRSPSLHECHSLARNYWTLPAETLHRLSASKPS